jgi:hypothetical protein
MAFELELEFELEFELELASSSKAGDSSPSAPTTRLNNVHGHPHAPRTPRAWLQWAPDAAGRVMDLAIKDTRMGYVLGCAFLARASTGRRTPSSAVNC